MIATLRMFQLANTLKNYVSVFIFGVLSIIASSLKAQTFNYGTGNISSNPAGFNTAGSFTGYSIVGNDLTVTGSITMPAGTYNFANVTINSGAIVTVPTGSTVPFIIRCTGAFVNNGDIRANGGNGGNASGATAGAAGLGCAGGTNGGVGGPGGSSATYPTSPLNFSANGSGVNFGTSNGGGKRMCHTVTNNYPT